MVIINVHNLIPYGHFAQLPKEILGNLSSVFNIMLSIAILKCILFSCFPKRIPETDDPFKLALWHKEHAECRMVDVLEKAKQTGKSNKGITNLES